MKADACCCPAAIWLLLCGGNLIAGCGAAALSHLAAHVVFCSILAHAAAVETIPSFCTICLKAVLPETLIDHLGLRIDMTKVRFHRARLAASHAKSARRFEVNDKKPSSAASSMPIFSLQLLMLQGSAKKQAGVDTDMANSRNWEAARQGACHTCPPGVLGEDTLITMKSAKGPSLVTPTQ